MKFSFCLPTLLTLTACLSPSTSPEPAYYQLQPVDLEAFPGTVSFEGLVLEPVEMADYLDRPQMAQRLEPHRLDYLEYHRWAEPLDENITDVMAANLASLAGPGVPVLTVAEIGSDPPRLHLRVLRFEAAPGGDAVLEAAYRWSPDGNSGRLRLDASVEGDTHSAAVAAQSRLLGELAEKLLEL